MKFSPETKTIRSMLQSYPIMNIPNFQRDYSWEEKNYSIFLEDTLKGLSLKNGKVNNSDYFIGTMVFSGSEKRDSSIDVIDGQQRLTIITILLSVITSKFKEINDEGLANVTFKYIKAPDDYNIPVPKLKSTTSYPYFEAYIQSIHKADIKPSSEEEINIKKTYEYFSNELSEEKLRKKLPFNSLCITYKDLLIAVRDQILLMNVISILTEDKNSAYEIFEILNAKGKNLAAIDLIKNTIYAKFHADENSKNKTIEKDWEDIKKILRDRNQNIGFITFYRHFWISKYKKITSAKLYDSFKQEIKPDKTTYEEFVKNLKREVENYLKIVCPYNSDYDNKKEYQWLVQSLSDIEKTFGVSQARIALLALFDVKSRELISMSAFKSAITFIENFIFAYSAVLKNQANIYETRFSKFAIKLRKSSSKIESNTILKEFLFDEFKNKFPPKSEFIGAFKNLQYSKFFNASNMITKYALNKINSDYDRKDIFQSDSSIEHIINEVNSNSATLNIGNLICLEMNLNNEANNLNFEEKIKIYKKSKYLQVKDFCDKYKNFSQRNFNERSEELAKYYYSNILNEAK